MSNTREYYLFGFFKDMDSENKFWFGFWFILFTTILSIVLGSLIYQDRLDQSILTATDCNARVLLRDEDAIITERLLLACKGVTIKQSCREQILTQNNIYNIDNDKITKLMKSCTDSEAATKKNKG